MTIQKKEFCSYDYSYRGGKRMGLLQELVSSCNKSTASGNSAARSSLTGHDTAHDTQFS